jgi:hypothetical protein
MLTAAGSPSVTRHPLQGRCCRVTLAALVLGVMAAACSESNRADDQPERRDTAADEQSTTTSQDGERDEVTDAFLAAGEAFNEAAGGPDPDYPLERTFTGPMLAQARAIVEGLAADGLVLRYPGDSQRSQTVTSVEFRGADVAILQVCTVDDGRRVRQDTGEVVVGGLSTVWADVAMNRVDDIWKLAERQETSRRDGEAVCERDR